MAFSRTRADRPESLIFRNPTSPRDETAFPLTAAPLSPLRNLASRVAPSLQNTSDVRGSLQRRFTTNALPPLAPIGEQRSQNGDNLNSPYSRISATERKAREYEALLAQQRRIQAQMALIDPETRREVDEVQRLERDISRFTSGVFSEPTTPPDYHATTPTSAAPFSHRLSTSTLASQSLSNRPSRSGSQLTSPPAEYVRPFTSHAASQLPSRSVPGSQRNSDHESSDDDYTYGFADVQRKIPNPNRNSMPVTAFDLRNQTNYSALLGSVDTTSFLFGDDNPQKQVTRSSPKVKISPDTKTYLQLHQTDDEFPILVRRETDSGLQFPSAALDLASDSPLEERQTRTPRAIATRHRQSLPPSAMRQPILLNDGISGLNGILSDAATAKNTAANRRSVEVKFSGLAESKRPSLLSVQQRGTSNGYPKVASSYSTNDIPTLKSINTAASLENNINLDNNTAVQSPETAVSSPVTMAPAGKSQYGLPQNNLFQKNVPASTIQSAQVAAQRQAQHPHLTSHEDENHPHAPPSALQPGATPFGPPMIRSEASAMPGGAPTAMAPYGAPAYYGGYGMQMLENGFGNMALGGGQSSWTAPQAMNPPFPSRGAGHFPHGQPSQPAFSSFRDNPGRNQRRGQNINDETARYAQLPLEALAGELASLCKDQYGCRFIQKKVEDGNPKHVQQIFEEIKPQLIELMTDPFGNYLCQKLFEYATEEQRTALVAAATPKMVKIAVNQHGTRALQKLIEFINTPEQIAMVIEALRYDVVQLIQDLNGNHVIQKCLNHLKQDNIQFIVDSVSSHVVAVGTHRHGCCVLQRCVDHATGPQKTQLVSAVTKNAFVLVQDPFGNYVVQYIMDLAEPAFSEPICRTFIGNIAVLSRQKFSSNVVEKGIRCASEDLRRIMINEMIESPELEKLLRDSFANYVVQTALDFSEADLKARFMDRIRPVLPVIRHAPHGRRIAAKLSEYDSVNNLGGLSSGVTTPSDVHSPGPLSLASTMSGFGPQSTNTSYNATPTGSVASPYGYMPSPSGMPYRFPGAPPNGHYPQQDHKQYQTFPAMGGRSGSGHNRY